jgi:uncharacterized membrane protein
LNRKLFRPLWILLTVLSALVAAFSYRYIVYARFVPANVAANRFFNPWIFVHAGAASTALLLGPTQFVYAIRGRWPVAHRWMGRVYVVACLLGGVAGVILASGVSTGPIAAAGFATLGLLWLYVTTRGLLSARAGEFVAHRRWMIRSFALTFAAVTLRLYIPISQIAGFEFTAAYVVIAWLAWVPNAIFAEWFLRPSETAQKPLLAD